MDGVRGACILQGWILDTNLVLPCIQTVGTLVILGRNSQSVLKVDLSVVTTKTLEGTYINSCNSEQSPSSHIKCVNPSVLDQ